MKVNNFNINVCSEHPDELIKFYADVVGLTPLPMISPGAFLARMPRYSSTATARSEDKPKSRSAC